MAVGDLDLNVLGVNAFNSSQVLNYTGENLTSIVVTLEQPPLANRVFTQTLAYTGDKLTSVSAWVES